jgi:hypothetical protein
LNPSTLLSWYQATSFIEYGDIKGIFLDRIKGTFGCASKGWSQAVSEAVDSKRLEPGSFPGCRFQTSGTSRQFKRLGLMPGSS